MQVKPVGHQSHFKHILVFQCIQMVGEARENCERTNFFLHFWGGWMGGGDIPTVVRISDN